MSADPPSWLSWSTGIGTDEGFYTLDARSEVLFGHWAIGNFHDRLLSPLLSFLQQGLFSLFGPDLWVARLLSIGFSILTLVFFWLGLKRLTGEAAADLGALFLGFAPPFVYYNRLALQETPTVFWLVLAFSCWAFASDAPPSLKKTSLFAVSGASLAISLLFKPLAGVALPAFAYLYYLDGRRGSWRALIAAVLAFGIVLVLYLLLWYLPYHAAILHMTSFYRTHQMQPHSLYELGLNLERAIIGGQRGAVPYLLALLPVLCLLAVWAFRRRVQDHAQSHPGIVLFGLWVLGGLAFCFLSSYAPSRYYVLFLPGLTGLAALGAVSLSLRQRRLVIVLFILSSAPWYVVSWINRVDTRHDAALWLAGHLPSHSVVIGDFAPALCLDTPFVSAPVQPGLSNDDHPVARLQATEIAVTQTPFWIHWWKARYPNIVQPQRRIATFSLEGSRRYVVKIYDVL